MKILGVQEISWLLGMAKQANQAKFLIGLAFCARFYRPMQLHWGPFLCPAAGRLCRYTMALLLIKL